MVSPLGRVSLSVYEDKRLDRTGLRSLLALRFHKALRRPSGGTGHLGRLVSPRGTCRGAVSMAPRCREDPAPRSRRGTWTALPLSEPPPLPDAFGFHRKF